MNNAGYGMQGQFLDMDFDAVEAMFRVNIVALTHLTQLFAQDMANLPRVQAGLKSKGKRGKVLRVLRTEVHDRESGEVVAVVRDHRRGIGVGDRPRHALRRP